MIDDDVIVVDMISHGFNHQRDNYKNEIAKEMDDAIFGMQSSMQPDEYAMSEEVYYTNHTAEHMEEVLFHESDVDHTLYSAQMLDDYFHDGYTRVNKGFEMQARNPHRVSVAPGINPLSDNVLEEIEALNREFDIASIKIYPVRYEDGEALKMALDDPEVGIPVIEKCIELGIERISVHKAVPLGRTAHKYYSNDDVAEAATMYPEIDFEIVHAGWAFLEDTKYLVGRYPNIHANLEITASLIINQPRRMAETLGEMLLWSGPDKIMFASGCTFVHPQPIIEAFWDFEMPKELQEEEGYPEVTEEIKRKILGLNACEFLNIDPDELRKQVRNDKWAHEKEDRPEPWSAIKSDVEGISTPAEGGSV